MTREGLRRGILILRIPLRGALLLSSCRVSLLLAYSLS